MAKPVDKFHTKIENDGTITVTTDKISPEQHFSAEQFLDWSAMQVGGKRTKEHRAEAHQHGHAHTHEHDHVHEGEK